MVTISIAGLNVGIDNKYDFERLVCRHMTDAPPDFVVSVSEDELDAENELTPHSREYLEFVCTYRKIAEKILEYDAFVIHGAAIARNDQGYLIAAPSGTGKTTHARLWIKHYRDAWIINGDKPILRRIDGVFYLCGTPWKGKERMGFAKQVPLKSIAFLHRSPVNEIRPLPGNEALAHALHQIYLPKEPEHMSTLLSLLNECLLSVPCYSLGCNMEEDAARLAYETMSRASLRLMDQDAADSRRSAE